MKFKHLEFVKQSYFEHLTDALSYSFASFKASVYFFIHGFWPDLFEFDGSKQIEDLNKILVYKKSKLIIAN
jgi:hypothetical protein